jgi:outer membrane protein
LVLKRSFLLLFIICSSAISIYAQAKKTTWTLEECLNYATLNNIAVRQADLAQKISQNTYLQSKLNVLPTVSTNAAYSFDFGYSINPTNYTFVQQNSQIFSPSGQANLNLFMGLQQINTIKKDKYDLLGYNSDYLNSINTTALNVTNLFLQVVLNKELIKVAQKQVDISQSQLDVARARIKAGTLAETAVYDFEAQLARDQATLIGQRNSEEISLLALQIALQLPDQQGFDIIVPEINIGSVMTFDKLNVREVYQFALQNQPSVKAAQARVMSALYAMKVAKGTLSPTFSVSYNVRDNYFNKATSNPTYTFNNGVLTIIPGAPIDFKNQFDQNLSHGVTFNMSLPIFTGWQRMTAVNNARLQYKIQEMNVENANNSLRKDVYQAYANAKGNAETYVANLKALESQKMAYETAKKRFDAGMAAAYELQQAQDNLARTESNTIQAKYNYIFSVKVLDFYQGKAITLN